MCTSFAYTPPYNSLQRCTACGRHVDGPHRCPTNEEALIHERLTWEGGQSEPMATPQNFAEGGLLRSPELFSYATIPVNSRPENEEPVPYGNLSSAPGPGSDLPALQHLRSGSAILLIATALALSGCRFDPDAHVHSATAPEPAQLDGTWFVPLKVAGTDDEWFFVPLQVGQATRAWNWPAGNSIDVVAGGKVWRITATDGGGFSYASSTEVPPSQPSGEEILTWIVLIVLILAAFVIASASIGVVAEHKKARSEAEEKLHQAEAEHAGVMTQIRGERADLEASRKSVEVRQRDLAARESAIQQEFKTLAAVRRKASPIRKTPTRDEWEAASTVVRAQAFSGEAYGNGIIVNYFFDPAASGLITFRWEITLDRPFPPKLVVSRNSRVVREEATLVKGEFADQLLGGGKRYRYQFKLMDGSRTIPDSAVFELIVPPFPAVQPEPPRPESAEERRNRKEGWRGEQYVQIEQLGGSADEVHRAKAAIDEEANRRFGEDV